MKTSRPFLCLIFTFLTFVFVHSLSAQVAHLTLQSQPGDFIGQGGNFDITYTPANSLFFSAQATDSIGMPPMPSEVHFTLGDPTAPFNTFTTLDFGTNQLGIPLQPGFYDNAQREAFASPGHPGLDVTFQNRGSNTLTGNFTINSITFGPNNVLQTFSVSFEQHSEGATPALFGTLTYNAVPEPAACVFIATGLALLAGSRLVSSATSRSKLGR